LPGGRKGGLQKPVQNPSGDGPKEGLKRTEKRDGFRTFGVNPVLDV